MRRWLLARNNCSEPSLPRHTRVALPCPSMSEKYPAHRAPLNATVKRVGTALLRADVVLIPPLLQRVIVRLSALSRRQIVQNRITSASILDLMLTVLRTDRISGQRYAPPSRKCIMVVPALFNCFFPSSPMSDGPIHVIKYSNSIQEINWLY